MPMGWKKRTQEVRYQFQHSDAAHWKQFSLYLTFIRFIYHTDFSTYMFVYCISYISISSLRGSQKIILICNKIFHRNGIYQITTQVNLNTCNQKYEYCFLRNSERNCLNKIFAECRINCIIILPPVIVICPSVMSNAYVHLNIYIYNICIF